MQNGLEWTLEEEQEDVLEPVVVKEQIIKSATEAASMLLRIDDVIAEAQNACWTTGWWRRRNGWYGWSIRR